MLLVYTGSDTVRAKAAARAAARGREVVRIGEGEDSLVALSQYLGQEGLFSPSLAVIVDRPLETKEGARQFLELAPACATSSTLVIAIEPDLDAAAQKQLANSATIETFDLPTPVKEELPSSFTLIDALQAGDRKRAWILYRQLIDGGVSAEEIHGALAWAARAVVLAARTPNALAAGMKPYPYGKAKAIAMRIGTEAAIDRSASLMNLYHEARRGAGTLEYLLEAYLLKR